MLVSTIKAFYIMEAVFMIQLQETIIMSLEKTNLFL